MRRTTILAGLLVLAAAVPVQAQTCSFAFSGVSFGAIDVTTGAAVDSAGVFQASCVGSPGTTIRICPNLGLGSGGGNASGHPRYMTSGASQLNYSLYQDAARTTLWGHSLSGVSGFEAPAVDITLGANGTGSASRTVYGRVLGSQPAVPAGGYASSVDGSVRYTTGTSLPCSSISTNATSAALLATASNLVACTIGAASLDFGAVAGLSSPVTGQTTLDVVCNVGTPYKIALGGGMSGATDPTQRRMSFAGNEIVYGLYRDAGHTQPWGNVVDVDTLAGTGTGAVQAIPVYGRIPVQTSPPVGTYRDTVVVTLTY